MFFDTLYVEQLRIFFTEPESLMPYVYPFLGFGCLAASFIMFLTYFYWDRTTVIATLAVHLFIEAIIMLLITLTTGQNPSIPRDSIRIYVVYLRMLMGINLSAVIFWQINRFKKENKGKHST
jgi:hypothetical protein